MVFFLIGDQRLPALPRTVPPRVFLGEIARLNILPQKPAPTNGPSLAVLWESGKMLSIVQSAGTDPGHRCAEIAAQSNAILKSGVDDGTERAAPPRSNDAL